MSDYFDEYGSNYKRLFSSISDLGNEKIFLHLESIYHEYQISRKSKKEYIFFEKTLDKPWQLARYGLTDELSHRKIELSDIISEHVHSIFNLIEPKHEFKQEIVYRI